MFDELARDDVFRLETRRLWLRWPQAADAPAFAALACDGRVGAVLPRPNALEDADDFIRLSREDNARGAALRFALTLKSGQRETVGVVSVEDFGGLPMLGYWLGRAFQGRGLVGEAAQAVVAAFFLLTRADDLGAFAPEENKPALGLLEKLGFVEDERHAGRHADFPHSRLILRRGDWRARGASLPSGLRSVTA